MRGWRLFAVRATERRRLPLLTLLFEGFVGKDYEELLFVLITLFLSMGVMVAFGIWWQR